MKRKFAALAGVFCLLSGLTFFSSCGSANPPTPKSVVVRAGHFPNITHAQAIIGRATGRFETKLAPAEIEWKIFNAGPSAIEALFAGHIDIVYVGPSPAVNAYVKSGGEAARVVAGGASGGAALMVRPELGISAIRDFKGKKIASPQLGNTQDVALRSWLLKNGLKLKERGGDVQVLPIAPADQQTLLLKKEIDGAWAVEPWVSIFSETTGAKIYLDEASLWPGGKYATTVVLVRAQFLKDHRDLVKKFLEVHVELTDWINQRSEEAKRIVAEEIERETHKPIPPPVLEKAWKRVRFTHEPLESSIKEQARAAYDVGFLKKPPDLAGLFDSEILEEVLRKKS